MSDRTPIVRDATPSDRADWSRMWAGCCAHYGTTIPQADVLELWRRILDPEHPVSALIAASRDGQDLLGFAHYVLRPHTFSSRMVCYLEDLWVEPARRGAGVGRVLIDTLIQRGRERGWRRVYWHTEADNDARRLYDRVAKLTNYVRYEVTLP